MTIKHLLLPEQNPKGRGLIQDGTALRILSECCGGVVDNRNRTEDHWTLPPWVTCTSCGTHLEPNHDHWKAGLDKIDRLSEDARDGGVYWNDWGLYWFGLEAFGMKVEK